MPVVGHVFVLTVSHFPRKDDQVEVYADIQSLTANWTFERIELAAREALTNGGEPVEVSDGVELVYAPIQREPLQRENSNER